MLTNLVITNNHAGDTGSHGGGGNGGGIDIEPLTVVTLTNSTVSGNRSGTSGLGGPGFAGGILNQGILTMTGSTVSNNTTLYVGGGILNRTIGAIKITNSTISGNQAPDGGGMYDDNSSGSSLTNCTIANNSPNGITASVSQPRVRNTIIAGNGAGADVSGTFTSQGNNLIGKSGGTNGFTNGSNSDQVGSLASPLDPRLGPLANNGGPTQTHALLADSTAIDAGNNCVINDSCIPSLGLALATDQRGTGFNRSADGNGDGAATVDIGAYEVQSILVTNTNDSGPGSLRQAITDTNANADTNAINFQAGLTGTITLLSALPDLSTSMSINGPGANLMTVARSAVGGTPNFRIFAINSGKTVKISGLTMSNGNVTSGLAPTNSGGAIFNSGTLTLTSSTVTGNNANPGGGGGIFNNGTLTLANSTVSGNSSTQWGGGIYTVAGTMNVINTTVSGNRTAGEGGGIVSFNATTTLTNVTITNNRSDFDNSGAEGGGGISEIGLSVTLKNTIVAGNFRGASGTTASDIANAGSNVSASSFNLIGTGGSGGLTNVNNNQVGVSNPLLGSLANNGGPTMTHALLPGSPAINAGSYANLPADTFDLDGDGDTAEPLPVDQRGAGFARISNTTVDIGAFESRGFSISVSSGSGQSTPINTAFGSPLVASVSSAFSEPVSGGVVTFSAPSSGASGTFPGNLMTVNAPINASGVATAPVFTANGIAGPYNVVASLSGGSPSANFAFMNLKGDQTITFNALANKTFGDPDFNVSAPSTSSLTVSFSAVGNCTVTGTLVHLTGAGSCTITANQAGDSNFNKAADVPQTFSIANAVTTTTVASSVNPSDLTQGVTFTATVTSGAGTPTGTVQFKDGGANIDLAQTLNAGGVAQLTISSLAAGTHTITADYNAGVNFLTSSGTLSGGQVVKSQPTLSINDVSAAEGNSGTTNFVFTVTLSAASNLPVNVDYATANGTATVADNDYQAVALSPLTFNPGEVTKTITVLVNGDQKFEPDETFFVNLTNAANATISRSQGVGTILNDDTLQLILDESGPDPNQAAAFDSLLFVRDPFQVQSIANWFDLGSDRNTRVIIFAANLQLNPGETASAVVVSLVDGNNQPFDVPAEDVRLAPNTNFAQVTFRLPNSLAPGACTITVKVHSQISNSAIIRIGP